MKFSLLYRLDQVAIGCHVRSTAQDVVVGISGQEDDGNVDGAIDLCRRHDAIPARPEVDVHQHQVWALCYRLPDSIFLSAGKAQDPVA